MVSQAINALPEGFQYQSANQKKLRETVKKKDGVSSVKGAKTLVVTNITSDTYDNEVERYWVC